MPVRTHSSKTSALAPTQAPSQYLQTQVRALSSTYLTRPMPIPMPRRNNRDFDSQLVAILDPSSSYTSAYASVNASASTYVDPRVLNGVLEALKGLGALHVMSHYSRPVHDVANPFGGRRRLPEDSIQIERSGQRSISLPPRASGGASYGGGGGSSGLDITSTRQQIHQDNHRATDKHLTEMDIDAIGMNNREEE